MAQFVHALAEAALYFPPRHEVHAPPPAEKVPAPQVTEQPVDAVCVVAAVDWPPGQAVQAERLVIAP